MDQQSEWHMLYMAISFYGLFWCFYYGSSNTVTCSRDGSFANVLYAYFPAKDRVATAESQPLTICDHTVPSIEHYPWEFTQTLCNSLEPFHSGEGDDLACLSTVSLPSVCWA